MLDKDSGSAENAAKKAKTTLNACALAAAISERCSELNNRNNAKDMPKDSSGEPATTNEAEPPEWRQEMQAMQDTVGNLAESVAKMAESQVAMQAALNAAIQRDDGQVHTNDGTQTGGFPPLFENDNINDQGENDGNEIQVLPQRGTSPPRAFPPPMIQGGGHPTATSEYQRPPPPPTVYLPTQQDDLATNMRVSESVKRKILAGEFVEMVDVLGSKNNNTSTTPTWTQVAPGQMIMTQEPQLSKRDLSLVEWTVAFNRFTYTYTQADCHKDEIRDMLAYMDEVISIGREGKDWAEYDRKFRQQRAEQEVGNKMRWSYFHHMHYNKCKYIQSTGNVLTGRNTSGRQHPQPFRAQPRQSGHANSETAALPPGYCMQYHGRDERCVWQSCKYSHKCPVKNCTGTHPVYLHNYYTAQRGEPRPTQAKRAPPKASNTN